MSEFQTYMNQDPKNISALGIPAAYVDYAFEHIELPDGDWERYVDLVLSNKNLLFCGNTGVGKTHIAVKLMMRWADKNARFTSNSSGYLFPVANWLPIFKTTSSIVRECQDCGKGDTTVSEVLEKYKNYEFMVWDEFPMRLTDFALNTIDDLFEMRTSNLKPTIITSNLNHKVISEMGLPRLISRVCGNGEIVELSGRDRRKDKPSSDASK